MIYLMSVLGGAAIGIIWGVGGWPRWTMYITAIAWGLLSVAVGVRASEPSNKLKAATVHLANGSGFVLKTQNGKNYLVTNYHVCLQGTWLGKLTGSLESGRVVRGRVVKTDIKPDLCAAYLNDRDLTPLELGGGLAPNQQIYTRGYPYGVLSENSGRFTGQMNWSYTFPIEEIGECKKPGVKEYSGTNTVIGCTMTYTDNLTDLYARPGSSGSPVVNEDGDLVGVISSWYGKYDAGGMVKFEDIKEFFRGL